MFNEKKASEFSTNIVEKSCIVCQLVGDFFFFVVAKVVTQRNQHVVCAVQFRLFPVLVEQHGGPLRDITNIETKGVIFLKKISRPDLKRTCR